MTVCEVYSTLSARYMLLIFLFTGSGLSLLSGLEFAPSTFLSAVRRSTNYSEIKVTLNLAEGHREPKSFYALLFW